MSPADRAKSLHALAEAARDEGDLRTAAALKGAAAAWERIAAPGVPWSHKRLRADIRQLRIDLATAMGPFQPPAPPKAPSPSRAVPGDAPPPVSNRLIQLQASREATIEF